jgi:hypothetical protein
MKESFMLVLRIFQYVEGNYCYRQTKKHDVTPISFVFGTMNNNLLLLPQPLVYHYLNLCFRASEIHIFRPQQALQSSQKVPTGAAGFAASHEKITKNTIIACSTSLLGKPV